MSGILQNVNEWHCVARKPVHEDCFEFALDVVEKSHAYAELLTESEGSHIDAVDIFPKQQKQQCNSDGTCVLYQEHRLPPHLSAEVFVKQCCVGTLNVERQGLGFVAENCSVGSA